MVATSGCVSLNIGSSEFRVEGVITSAPRVSSLNFELGRWRKLDKEKKDKILMTILLINMEWNLWVTSMNQTACLAVRVVEAQRWDSYIVHELLHCCHMETLTITVFIQAEIKFPIFSQTNNSSLKLVLFLRFDLHAIFSTTTEGRVLAPF